MTLAILSLYVHPVELVIIRFLITLAFKNLLNLYILPEQNRDETFKNFKIRLITKHVLHEPVKPYIAVIIHILISLLNYKFTIKNSNLK